MFSKKCHNLTHFEIIKNEKNLYSNDHDCAMKNRFDSSIQKTNFDRFNQITIYSLHDDECQNRKEFKNVRSKHFSLCKNRSFEFNSKLIYHDMKCF